MSFISKRGADIHWDGPIAQGDAARFAKLLGPDTRRLVIRSGGGEANEAFQIAKLIQDHHLSVLVHGHCASACASILFVAAQERELEDDAYLAFHASQQELIIRMASVEIAKRAKAPEQDLLDSLDKIDGQFKALFQHMGVTEELNEKLSAMEALVPGTVTITDITDEENGNSTLNMHAKRCGFLVWVPDEQGLSRIGVKLIRPYTRPDREKIAKAMDMRVQDVYFDAINDVIRRTCDKTEMTGT